MEPVGGVKSIESAFPDQSRAPLIDNYGSTSHAVIKPKKILYTNKPSIEVIKSIEKAKEVTNDVVRKTAHLDTDILNKLQVSNKIKIGLAKEAEIKKRMTIIHEQEKLQ